MADVLAFHLILTSAESYALRPGAVNVCLICVTMHDESRTMTKTLLGFTVTNAAKIYTKLSASTRKNVDVVYIIRYPLFLYSCYISMYSICSAMDTILSCKI